MKEVKPKVCYLCGNEITKEQSRVAMWVEDCSQIGYVKTVHRKCRDKINQTGTE